MGHRAVTFDLDDTLAVVERDRGDILLDAATAVGAPPISRADYLAAHERVQAGTTREPIFETVLAEVGATGVDAGALATAYRRRIGAHLRRVAGVEPMLETLAGTVQVGLITNGPVRAQRDKLERLGWTDRFDTTVISGRVGAHKPRAAPFVTACDRLGVAPGDVVHVGDHPVHDVAGALNAGLDAIQVVGPGEPGLDAVQTIPRERLAAEVPRLTLPAVH